jgi:Uma2 family endonuclease
MGVIDSPLRLMRHRLTVAEYYRLPDAGVLGPEDRVELIEGEVVDMAPISPRHAAFVRALTSLISAAARRQVVLSVHDPLHLDDHSEPQPDVMVLRPSADFYASAHPTPADVWLLIEVSDTTARYDREIKVPLYARAGVQEVWVVDLEARVLRCHRGPRDGEYTHIQSLSSPGKLPIPGLDGLTVDLSGLLL